MSMRELARGEHVTRNLTCQLPHFLHTTYHQHRLCYLTNEHDIESPYHQTLQILSRTLFRVPDLFNLKLIL